MNEQKENGRLKLPVPLFIVFVGLVFSLVAYIYVGNQTQAQEDLRENKASILEVAKKQVELNETLIRIDGRLRNIEDAIGIKQK